MKLAELRKIALRAARSYLRAQGADPARVDAQAAMAALDDLYRIDRATLASIWYGQASDNQVREFRLDWQAWQIGEMRND